MSLLISRKYTQRTCVSVPIPWHFQIEKIMKNRPLPWQNCSIRKSYPYKHCGQYFHTQMVSSLILPTQALRIVLLHTDGILTGATHTSTENSTFTHNGVISTAIMWGLFSNFPTRNGNTERRPCGKVGRENPDDGNTLYHTFLVFRTIIDECMMLLKCDISIINKTFCEQELYVVKMRQLCRISLFTVYLHYECRNMEQSILYIQTSSVC